MEHYFAETVQYIKEKSSSAKVFISYITSRVGGDVKYVNDIIHHVCESETVIQKNFNHFELYLLYV